MPGEVALVGKACRQGNLGARQAALQQELFRVLQPPRHSDGACSRASDISPPWTLSCLRRDDLSAQTRMAKASACEDDISFRLRSSAWPLEARIRARGRRSSTRQPNFATPHGSTFWSSSRTSSGHQRPRFAVISGCISIDRLLTARSPDWVRAAAFPFRRCRWRAPTHCRRRHSSPRGAFQPG